MRYFDNARFYEQDPNLVDLGGNDEPTTQASVSNVVGVGNPDGITTSQFIPSEYECYNLSEDPTEENNLLSPFCETPLDARILKALQFTLREQRKAKRLLPQNLNEAPQKPVNQQVPIRR